MKKRLKNLLSLFLFVQFLQASQSIEVGYDDGGEYCYRIRGVASGMFPDKEQKIERSSDRPGTVPCGCPVVVDNFIPVDWSNCNMDFERIRNFFPILTSVVHDLPFIFFDSAATAQMPQPVLDSIVQYYQEYKSNVGRGLYLFAEQATFMFESARAKIAQFIGAQKEEIIFTSGATAAINLVAQIWAQCHIQAGDEIIVSEVEHNANFIPWQQLAQRKGAFLKIVPLTNQGIVDLEALKNMVSEKTKLVAVAHQSNILGTSNDVKAIAEIAHSVGAKILVDAAQSIAHQKIDVKNLNCDFLAFSGHKLYGPTGVGVLFIKKELFEQCMLINFGGGAVLEVTPEHTNFKPFPHCLEPGTQAIAQVIGLGAAVDFVQENIDFAQAQEHETRLVKKLAYAIAEISGITLLSPIPAAGFHNNLVTFTTNRCHAYDVAEFLNERGIAVRAGYHCVQPYHDKYAQGISSVRVSVSVYNTVEEIDFLIDCLKQLFKD
ncbi:cysteine desulfurase [Candidatus Babeliales bacterium]|nr:cysteine desulfurase [Candidatus Babeliales bacterium]